ncbi:Hpt domain-containing protein [Spongiibacter taiwanensis]|uniref:hybrid sensor histidine kinase/response regulator n=1 Tax=Spongiibacter taiwanensis TaxID=1748242 RepID=UPI00203581BA|nr:Hpt domain-containing protein [Spongiibacter taiwanensis]USA44787.1 Hpt domain-containing protein [Spongiibacter taiwanensis]
MIDHRDYVALDWVAGEIAANLAQCASALGEYLHDSAADIALERAEGLLLQARGSLRMIEFSGAQRLLNEMAECVANLDDNALTEQQRLRRIQVLQVLCDEVPAYLARLRRSRWELPASLMIMFNELRSVMDRPLLSSTLLFTPEIKDPLNYSQRPADLSDTSFIELAGKLRQMYRLALAAWERGEAPENSVTYMAKVAGRATRLCAGTPQESLWLASLALFEGLANESVVSCSAVDAIMVRLGSALGLLAELGAEAAQAPLNQSLIKDVLFYVACSPGESRFVTEVQRLFVLDKVLADRDVNLENAAAAEALTKVAAGIAADMRLLAERLENGEFHPGRFDLREMSDALAIIGAGEVLHSLDAMAPLFGAELAVEQQQNAAKTLVLLADTLAAERELPRTTLFRSDPEAQLELDSALQALSAQSREVLADAQEQLLSFVADKFTLDTIGQLPAQLAQLVAALNLAELNRPAAVLARCLVFIDERLLKAGFQPGWEELDALADAIAAIDYYLERIVSSSDAEDGALMAVAEECVARLGYPVSDPLSAADGIAELVFAPAELPPQGQGEVGAETGAITEAAPGAGDEANAAPDQIHEPAAEIAQPPFDEASSGEAVTEGEAGQLHHYPDGVDPEIAEVFLEEAGEVLARLAELLPAWHGQLDNADTLADVRRAFHTLKGSGRMVQADQVGELGWAVENMLNRVIDGRFAMDGPRLAVVEAAAALTPDLLQAFRQGLFGPGSSELDALIQEAKVLTEQQSPALSAEEATVLPLVSAQDGDAPEGEAAPEEAIEYPEVLSEPPADDSLLGIFINEADTHLTLLEEYLAEVDSYPVTLTDAVQRALHTLKGASNMAEVWAIANLVTPLEGLVKELRSMRIAADEALIAMMKDVVDYSRGLTESLRRQPLSALRTPAELLQRLEELSAEMLSQAEMSAYNSQEGQLAPGALNSFLASFGDELLLIGDQLASGQIGSAEQLRRIAPGLGGFAYRAEEMGAEAIAELSHALQVLLGHAEDPVADALTALAAEAVDQLVEQLNQIAAEQAPSENAELLARMRDFDPATSGEPPLFPVEEVDETEAADVVDVTTIDVDSALPADAVEPDGDGLHVDETMSEIAPEMVPDTAPERVAEMTPGLFDDDMDPEILQVFLEEAGDLLEVIDQSIHSWSENGQDLSALDKIQRSLHTLKGGARLAGLSALGDVSHEFETAITDALGQSEQDHPALLAQLNQYQDQLVQMVDGARQPASVSVAPVSAEPEARHSDLAEFDFAKAFAPKAQPKQSDALLVGGEEEGTGLAPLRGPQEMIKVSSQLLERLINLAGETSISRARSEEQVGEIQASLEEMEITVERLQDQVRRMDMETEAQILFRQEQVGSEGADGFDPLEFDRYSQLQQYSRSLLESASDLTDLRSTLLEKSRDMETLLLQQSRIHADLQEGLMRSQMVHFSRMVPRLRRGVRQLASELGKRVEFKVYNADGEMDRRVLERIIPALEHMLRNSIDHGIEPEAARLAAGKAAAGEVAMRFDRQGGDVVIAISDDGGGVNLAAVRDKALKMGLITEDAVLSERQLLEYIFHAGFSTASNLTQISGRGVGMDVVRAEIKQLGGTIDIRTEAGRGTRFEVRLPFTVSVNRALMVSAAGEPYAVPLNNIEGIVRVSPYELEVYYQDDLHLFEYAGQQYHLRYLGGLVGQATPKLEGQVDLKPVLLIRNAEPPTAVQVDSLMGSREVVVKSLGPQFASVPALSGAAVMGDGQVVVILDMLAAIRADSARRLQAGDDARLPAQPVSGNLLVMVVDDSVTVRKVTSRLLERQRMDVLLARDGMEAVTLVQDIERLPDVVLLDIEMPRMDGFEVLVRLRGNPRTQDIPVIMISSRTGEKHRQRADALGVQQFLGKPYQETQLLQAISQVSQAVQVNANE